MGTRAADASCLGGEGVGAAHVEGLDGQPPPPPPGGEAAGEAGGGGEVHSGDAGDEEGGEGDGEGGDEQAAHSMEK